MWRLIITCAVVLILASATLGDGVMISMQEVGQSKPIVASPRQEALMVFDGAQVQVILRTYFRAGPKELAWIIPVPAAPTDIRPADDKIFDELESSTAPQFYQYVGRGFTPLGCGCGAMADRAGVYEGSVTVEASGTAGIFDWTSLGATDAQALLAWLADHQYAAPVGAERVLAPYVRDHWHWLAVKVRPEVADKPTLAPHPITYTYRATSLVYPLAISQLSADLENEILLYVLANKRYSVSNWRNEKARELTPLKRDPASPSKTNYEALLRQATDKADGHLFVTEYAQDINESVLLDRITGRPSRVEHPPTVFLTRLRAVMTAKAMDRDVSLVPDASGQAVDRTLLVASSRHLPSGLLLALFSFTSIAVVSARFLLTGGRWFLRMAGAGALLAAVLAVAAL